MLHGSKQHRVETAIQSPAIAVIEALLGEGAQVPVYDPAAMPRAKGLLPEEFLTYAGDPYDAAAGCDASLILAEWKEFGNLDLRKIRSLLRHPVVIDGRNLYRQTRGWALFVWGYALAWFLVNDRVKLAAYRVFDPRASILRLRFSSSSCMRCS